MIPYPQLLLLMLMGMALEASINISTSNNNHYVFKPTINQSLSTEENMQSEIIDDSLKLFSPYDPSEVGNSYKSYEALSTGILNKATLFHLLRKYILPSSLHLINSESFEQTENEYADYDEVRLLNIPRAEKGNNNQAIKINIQKVIYMKHLCFQNKYESTSLIACGDKIIESHACVNIMNQKITPCKKNSANDKLAYLCFLNEQPNLIVECNKTNVNFCSVLQKDATRFVLCHKEKERLCFQEGVGLQSCAEILKLGTEDNKKNYNSNKNYEFFFPKLRVLKRRSVEIIGDSSKRTEKFVHCEKCEINIDLIVDKSKPKSPPEIMIKTKEFEGYNYTNKG